MEFININLKLVVGVVVFVVIFILIVESKVIRNDEKLFGFFGFLMGDDMDSLSFSDEDEDSV